MKTIIAGSRKGAIARYVNLGALEIEKLTGRSITEVVSGCAEGADELGQRWAKRFNVPIKKMPANWYPNDDSRMDRAAGHKRNRQMGDYAEALVAIWDGKSKGTRGMIEYAQKKGLPMVVVNYGEGILQISTAIAGRTRTSKTP